MVESDLDKTTTNLNESVASPVVADAAKKETTSDDVKQVNSQDNSAEMPKVQRKRRWFTPSSDPLKSISTNNSVAISSDSLKVLKSSFNSLKLKIYLFVLLFLDLFA